MDDAAPLVDVNEIDDAFLRFAWLNLKPQERALILSKAPKTFWLFGAGASHHYDLNAFGVPVPLANGFFRAFHRLPTSQGFHAHVGPLISFLREYRGVPPDQVAGWDEDIEDFMTSIERRLDELKESAAGREFTADEFGDVISYAQVFSNMNFIFASVLNEAQNGPPVSLYRTILALSTPYDSFVTFNWDTLLDRALMDTGGWSPNAGYGLRFRAVLDGSWKDSMDGVPAFTTNWRLLKLHGSTNWLVPYTAVHFQTLEYKSIIPDNDEVFLYWYSSLPYATHKNRWTGGYVPATYCYYPPNIPGEYFSKAQLSPEPDRVFVRGNIRFLAAFEEGDAKGVPSSPVLITPVRQKRYDAYASTVQSLWTQAVKALEMADRIVVVGYSFPRTDTRSLDLFRSVLMIRGSDIALEIVSPHAADVVGRIGDEYVGKAREVKLRDMKFEDYVDLLAESMPPLMRQAATEYKEVREWLERIYMTSRVAVTGSAPSRASSRSSTAPT